MNSQPILDTLSRAELLHLIVNVASRTIIQRDILLARWQVRERNWRRLSQRAVTLRCQCDIADDDLRRCPNDIEARRRFDQAETAWMSAERAAKLAWLRRADAYLALGLADEEPRV